MGTSTERIRRGRPAAADGMTQLGRAGLAAQGALYVVIGLLATEVARGDRSEDAEARGAIEAVVRQPYGQWLLAILTAGLLALAGWRAAQALHGDPIEGDDPADRVGFGFKAAVYGSLAAGAASILLANLGTDDPARGASTEASQGPDQQEAAAVVLDWPGGRWLVGLAGLGVIAYGLESLWSNALQAEFRERLRSGSMSPRTARIVTTIGRAGYGARGIVFALVGYFLARAALTYDATEAKGLSGSLATIARDDGGRLLLWAVAVGLVAFGVFKVAEARYRRAA